MKRFESTNYKILLTLVLVPFICVGVFFLPVDIQQSLAMRSDNPNPLTFMTSIFIHGNAEHLIGNIMVFLITSIALYIVNRLSQGTTFFLYSLVSIVFLLPLSYGAVFLVLNNVYFHFSFLSFGLSLVDGGLIGLVVPTLMHLMSNECNLRVNRLLFFLSMVCFTGAVILAPYAWPSFYTVTLFFLMVSTGILFGAREMLAISRFARTGSKKHKIKALLILFGLMMYFTFLALLFPSNIIHSPGNITNIFAHFFGVFFGLFVGTLISETRRDDKTPWSVRFREM